MEFINTFNLTINLETRDYIELTNSITKLIKLVNQHNLNIIISNDAYNKIILNFVKSQTFLNVEKIMNIEEIMNISNLKFIEEENYINSIYNKINKHKFLIRNSSSILINYEELNKFLIKKYILINEKNNNDYTNIIIENNSFDICLISNIDYFLNLYIGKDDIKQKMIFLNENYKIYSINQIYDENIMFNIKELDSLLITLIYNIF